MLKVSRIMVQPSDSRQTRRNPLLRSSGSNRAPMPGGREVKQRPPCKAVFDEHPHALPRNERMRNPRNEAVARLESHHATNATRFAAARWRPPFI
jgi:hypothetical protein